MIDRQAASIPYGAFLHVEHHLEQRSEAAVAGRMNFCEQFFERQFAGGFQLFKLGLQPLNQTGKSRLSRKLSAKHNGIGEGSHGFLMFWRSHADWNANGKIKSPGVARKHG